MFTKLIKLILILTVVLFQACDQNVVFEKNNKVDYNGWHYDDKVSFSLKIADTDTLSLHNLYLNVRNNNEYPYSNFFVFFETEFPDGRIFRDTIETILADRTGSWTGKGFGNLKFNSFLFRTNVWFPLEGEYSFTIQHAMRKKYLTGITDIGIRIEKK